MTAGVLLLGLFGLLLAAGVLSVAIRMFRTAVGKRPSGAVAKADLARLLREALPEAMAGRLAHLIRPSILMGLTSTPRGGLVPGGSRVGGPPDLPPGVDWPARKGRRMTFLAQINCTEAARAGADLLLPPAGLLLFFHDAERPTADLGDGDAWRVIHSEVPPPPSAAPPAPAAPPDGSELDCREVTFSPDFTLPPWDAPDTYAVGLEGEQLDAYLGLLETLAERRGARISRMFGHPDCLQDGRMGLRCQLAAAGLDVDTPAAWRDPRVKQLARGAADWVLLLQLDCPLDTSRGDAGRLYFYARRHDLLALRFDDVRLVSQRR